MQAVLVMIRSDGERRSFSIARDMTVIGRREDCDLRIPLGEISRKHCRLVRDGDVLRLEDLGSSNGTYHNGERVQESILAPGDTIQIGPVIFALQIDGVPADEDLHPVAPQELASAGASDMDTEVTQGEYAEGEYAEGEYAAEEVAEDEVAMESDYVAESAEGEVAPEGEYIAEEQVALEVEYAAEGEQASEEQLAEAPSEGEYAAEDHLGEGEAIPEGEHAVESEHAAESAAAPAVAEEDELFLTEEQIVGEAEPEAAAAAHGHEAAPEDELELESDDFILDTPEAEAPEDELHLENLDVDIDAQHPHHPNP